jgi:hypothetical protein
VSSSVVVALRVRATPERAFEVFTRDIGLWWRPNPMFSFTPRSPGVMAFEGGEGGRLVETLPNGKVFEVGRIRIWAPGARLVFGWRCAAFAPGLDTEVDVRFEEAGEETRIRVEHRGWEQVPSAHAARHGFPLVVFLKHEAEWWRRLLSVCAELMSER